MIIFSKTFSASYINLRPYQFISWYPVFLFVYWAYKTIIETEIYDTLAKVTYIYILNTCIVQNIFFIYISYIHIVQVIHM